MTRNADWTAGPAKIAAATVLGACGVLGVARSFVVDRNHEPPVVAAQPELLRITPERSEPKAIAPELEPAIAISEPKPLAADDSIAVRINVNNASSSELQLLPRIGPVYAERIIADRAANGPFTSLKDLQRVSGIGPKTAERLEPLVWFDQP